MLDGRVVRLGVGGLTAIDGRTGETVWTTPIAQTANSSLVTDGRVVLVTQRDLTGGVVLAAYGLDDGRQRWHAAVADDLWLLEVGGGLHGWSGQGFVALG